MSKLLRWIRKLKAWLIPDRAIVPHPEMTTDQGQRRHAEREMESQSWHVGRPPRPM